MNRSALVRSKLDFISQFHPQAWDATHPHTPSVVSDAYVNLLVADVVKQVGEGLVDKGLSANAAALSKKIAAEASSSLASSWEPGDELCPPYTVLVPVPRPTGGPEPDPWKEVASAEQIDLAFSLTKLAGLTSSAEFSTALKGLATSVARSSASHLAEDFERCGTKPRPPIPPRRR